MINKKNRKNENVKIILKGMIDKDMYTIDELAEKLSVSRTTITRWFKSNSGIKEEKIIEIEKKLGIKFDKNKMLRDIYGKFYL